jgi:prepilin-type N-terminal cleavage/methylation domain-containing protein
MTRRGFTLIELLIVIAIITILAGLLFPVFANAKESAKTTATLSNLRQLSQATLMYAGDADDRYPLVTEGSLGSTFLSGYTVATEFGASVPGIFAPEKGSLYPYVKSAGVYVSALDPTSPQTHQTFAFNGCLTVFPPPPGLMPTQTTTEAEFPAGQFVFAEELSGNGGTNDGFFHPLVDVFASWHFGKTAMVYVDGHAKTQHAKERVDFFSAGEDKPCWPYEPLIGR